MIKYLKSLQNPIASLLPLEVCSSFMYRAGSLGYSSWHTHTAQITGSSCCSVCLEQLYHLTHVLHVYLYQICPKPKMRELRGKRGGWWRTGTGIRLYRSLSLLHPMPRGQLPSPPPAAVLSTTTLPSSSRSYHHHKPSNICPCICKQWKKSHRDHLN